MTAKQTCDLANAMEALGYEIFFLHEETPIFPDATAVIHIKIAKPEPGKRRPYVERPRE